MKKYNIKVGNDTVRLLVAETKKGWYVSENGNPDLVRLGNDFVDAIMNVCPEDMPKAYAWAKIDELDEQIKELQAKRDDWHDACRKLGGDKR